MTNGQKLRAFFNRKSTRAVLLLLLLSGLTAWVHSRWSAWFSNPPEAPYTVPDVPSRVMLTFGDGGEASRYVSWMCDTVVTEEAELILAHEGDTVRHAAIGEVFRSRSGKAAYYRVMLDSLQPNTEYAYQVRNGPHCSPWYTFRVHQPNEDEFSFLFVGDVQDSIGGVTNTFLKRAVREHPEVEFVAFGGDLIERLTDAYWAETFRSVDSICTAMPILNITGNHDYLKYLIRRGERRFALVFPYFLKGMEERGDRNHLFNLKYHGAELFCVDSERGFGFLLFQRSWLQKKIKESTAQHKILLCHHPLYSVKHKNNNLIQRWMLDDIVGREGVDLVLQGHEHAYARCGTKPLYTISHCSPKTYRIHPTERFDKVLSGSRYYQVITVRPNGIEMRAYDAISGEMVDKAEVH